ncbi:MAG: SIMPL domain-containing protein [Bacteroidota bacterium]
MSKQATLFISALLIVVLLVGTAVLTGAGSPRRLTVQGEGTATVAPDRARITLGVEADGTTARAAQNAAAKRLSAVLAALRRAGVPGKDLKTVTVSLEPRREYDPKTGREQFRGYRAVQRLEATLTDPAGAGAVLDTAVAAGADTVGGIEYYLSDPAGMRGKALAAAIADARRRAAAVAEAAGLRVRGVLTVEETSGSAESPQPFLRGAKMEDAAQTPSLPGLTIIRAEVRAQFAAGRSLFR